MATVPMDETDIKAHVKDFWGDIEEAEQLPGQMGGQFGGIEGKPKLNMTTVNVFFEAETW